MVIWVVCLPGMSHQVQLSADELDAVFDCLSNRRRRVLIRCLADARTPVSVDALSRKVSHREGVMTSTGVTGQSEILSMLRHRHLPKLDDADVIELDGEQELIDTGSCFSVACSHLE